MSNVFVIDTDQQKLSPVHPGRARLLLKEGKAAVYRRYPFTLILKRRVEDPAPAPLRLKIDPGSVTTGLAIVQDDTGEVVWAAELTHRGKVIKHAMDARRALRRSRRQRQTRYRKPRFQNRRRRKGTLPPSLASRVQNILTWVARLSRLCLITALSQELVRFDLHAMQRPGMAGVQYQQGTLAGYEVREWVLEKWKRRCAYCGARDVPLQVEHIQPRARGGTDRPSNLCLACEPCNQAKGAQDISAFLRGQPERLAHILAQVKEPLTDASAVNTTRWALAERLKATGLPLEVGSGGLTKFNRTSRNLPKTHWLDAACVGTSTPESLDPSKVFPLLIEAKGRGRRKMCNTNALGFPTGHRKRRRRYFGYQSGDVVRAVVPERLKCAGTHVGQVAVKAAGTFSIETSHGKVTDVPYRYCRLLHRSDGYAYQPGARISSLPPSPKGAPVSAPARDRRRYPQADIHG